MSLITNIFAWDAEFDSWSVVAAIGTTAFWSLNISQLILSSTAEYGFGKMRIDGGNCPRKLISSEKCDALEFMGCSELPQVPVLEDISINITEFVGGRYYYGSSDLWYIRDVVRELTTAETKALCIQTY